MIGTLSGNQSLDYYTKSGIQLKEELADNELVQAAGGQLTQKSVIIMDEVDGCGASDRGGLLALVQVIKATRSPIICICNDRQNRKLATLLTYCYDLKFQTPTPQAIKKRVSKIVESEGLKIDETMLDQLIQSSGGGDLRQIINILQMWKNQHRNFGEAFLSGISKDESVMINNFDAAHKLLNCGEKPLDQQYPTFRQKLDLFFIDYDFIPLLVQEAYLNSFQNRKEAEDLEAMAEAADMISIGDQLNVQIRTNQNWALLPNLGICSTVAPCLIAQGRSLYPWFPAWLGKNSSARKAKRLIRELKQAMAHRVSANRFAVQNEMVPYLLQEILYFLRKGSKDALLDLIAYLDDLNISNEMIKEHLLLLTLDPKIHD